MAKKVDRKKCFVVGPIGADDSEDRIHADWLLEMIIQPVFEEHFKDFDVTRADKISDPGRIDAQVISSLLDSELVIADLTTLNPNAFYEIGIRHTVQRPIIHMHLEGERIPFDIASFRSIKFDRKRPKDLIAAREALRLSVMAALDEAHQVDNPVTFARGRVEFDKTATPAERVVQEQLEAMMTRLEALERPRSLADRISAKQLQIPLDRAARRKRAVGIDIRPGEGQSIYSDTDMIGLISDALQGVEYTASSFSNGVYSIFLEQDPDDQVVMVVLNRLRNLGFIAHTARYA
ncbi:MAG: hypothetical protein QE284_18620 [Rhizobium sp.]|nr:hypothetical protein [Rhizobium sp.]